MKPTKEEARASGLMESALSAQLAAMRLDAALDQNDTMVFMTTLKEVIRARGGFTVTASKTGLNRTALYKIVSKYGNPGLSTLVVLLSVVGLRLSVVPLGGSKGVRPGVAKPNIEGIESENLTNNA